MSKFQVSFQTAIEVVVTIEAEDDDEAGDDAWTIASEYLNTVYGEPPHVRAEATLDGVGAYEVTSV